METLSHNDILALNRAIGEIYAARAMKSFYRSVIKSIQGVIPCDLASVADVNFHPYRVLSGTLASDGHGQIFGKLQSAFNAHLQEHPLFPHCFSDKVVKIGDFASRSRFKSIAIYNEYYRHLDIDTQISFSIPLSENKLSLFALSRNVQDFSERDRLILVLLKPHLINAFRNAAELGRISVERDLLQKGAEAERLGAVMFQSDGTMLCISPLAKVMFKRYFDAVIAEGDILPSRLLQWVMTEGPSTRVEREPLTIKVDDRCLKINLLNDFTTGDYIIVMSERETSMVFQNLQGYGLSCREAEVLELLSTGKTNVEVAIVLGLSRRTVEKHVENIFMKLGVESRSALMAMVMQK